MTATLAPPPPKKHPYNQWTPAARALDLAGDKWTLLIVRELLSGPVRFVELQRALPGISTEQLRSRLNRMVADGLLGRQRYREVPPRVDYSLTPAGRDLEPLITAAAWWGLRHAWSAPRRGEDINVASLLRDATGLIETPILTAGLWRLTVERATADDRVVDVEILDGAAHAITVNGHEPDGIITGTSDHWIAALQPVPADQLTIAGDTTGARLLLGEIHRVIAEADAR